jgi:hypothetical protein
MTGQEGEIYHIPVAHPFNRVNTSEHADGGIGRGCCRFVLRSAEFITGHRGLVTADYLKLQCMRQCFSISVTR